MTDRSILPEHVRRVVNDPDRLQALLSLETLDTPPDADFDRLSRVAAHIFKSQTSLITLVNSDRQWFRSCFGLTGLGETRTDDSFCAHTIALPGADDVLVVLDASQDDRFRDNSLVLGWPHIRFYAGAAVKVGNQKIGSICVIDTVARDGVDPDLVDQLVDLAALASALFELKNEARVRARTSAALLREEWRHALTLEAGKVGSWVWDVKSGEISCNETFRRMYDLPEPQAITFDAVMAATHPDDRQAVQNGIDASFQNGADFGAEARAAVSGRWLTMRGRVYQRDADGAPLVMMGASVDISESKQSAEQTRHLLRELNHRVKNTLAMIQSAARQTIRQNPDPQDFTETFSGRLRTISDMHVLLADHDWTGVQLFEVIGAQLGSRFRTHPDRAYIRGDDVTLPADHALGLGLILHELTTNAHRYGAWANDRGVVHITWAIENAPSRGLRMTWREEGGRPVSMPEEQGLGVRLIERSLAKVLDSEVKLTFAADGVVAQIWLPLPA